MKDSFNFCLSGNRRYVGFSKNFRAEITRDAVGKKHLQIVKRAAQGDSTTTSTAVLFETSLASVQACKKSANEFLKEAC